MMHILREENVDHFILFSLLWNRWNKREDRGVTKMSTGNGINKAPHKFNSSHTDRRPEGFNHVSSFIYQVNWDMALSFFMENVSWFFSRYSASAGEVRFDILYTNLFPIFVLVSDVCRPSKWCRINMKRYKNIHIACDRLLLYVLCRIQWKKPYCSWNMSNIFLNCTHLYILCFETCSTWYS